MNTGLLCGFLIGIDIDVLHPQLAAEDLTDRVVALLGPTPLRRIGRAPKILLCYRVLAPNTKIATPDLFFDDGEKAKVEVLAQGQHFVGFGIHPETQSPYRWIGPSPLDVPLGDLPIVTLPALENLVADAEARLRDAGGATKKERRNKISSNAQAEARQTAKRERKGRLAAALRYGEKPDRETVADALNYIANDLDYDDWIKIGFALYHGLGPAGRDLWESWSATSSKNDAIYTSGKWDTFANGHSVTVATLFWFAQENG